MGDNKKYYYMRLKENFFESDQIVLLESMPDGILYTNILLKMYLKSLKTEGLLILNGLIPYNANMISAITRQPVGVVEKALQVFEQIGLIDVLDNGAIYMSDIQLFIGQSSTEAERKKKSRLELGIIKSGQMSDKCPTDVHHSIENIDNSIDKKKSISTNVDIPKEKEFSFDKHTNKENLDYFFEHDEKFKKIKENFKQALSDWCEYKDQRKPKNKHHYTEKGLRMLINQAIDKALEVGTRNVINQINKAIASTWDGMNLDMIDKEKNNGRF